MTIGSRDPATVTVERCDLAIRRGVEFLRRRQLPSGEFETLVGPDADLLKHAQPDPSPFATMHVATSLLEVGHDDASAIVARAAEFLRSEMLPGGLWRFWAADHPGSPGIPPDTDDTACITHLLRRLGTEVPDNRGCLLANRDRRGLFRTWILPRPGHTLRPRSWPMLVHSYRNRERIRLFFRSGPQPPAPDGVAAVVNANALLLFRDDPSATPVIAWLSHLVQTRTAATADEFYQSDLALYYAISRCMEQGVTSVAALTDRVLASASRMDATPLTVLETALLMSVLAMLGDSSSNHAPIEKLLSAQCDDGSWPARGFYFSGFQRDFAWGSAELTTGFCVEALARALRRNQ